MGTPLSHGWQQLRDLKRDRPRQAGPTSGGVLRGRGRGAGLQEPHGHGHLWARRTQPQPGCLSWGRASVPHPPTQDAPAPVSSLHTGLRLSPKALCPLPSHEPFPACQRSAFPRAGTCSRAPASCSDSVSPCLDQGIAFTFVQVCWVAAETSAIGPQRGETCREPRSFGGWSRFIPRAAGGRSIYRVRWPSRRRTCSLRVPAMPEALAMLQGSPKHPQDSPQALC